MYEKTELSSPRSTEVSTVARRGEMNSAQSLAEMKLSLSEEWELTAYLSDMQAK